MNDLTVHEKVHGRNRNQIFNLGRKVEILKIIRLLTHAHIITCACYSTLVMYL